MSRADGDRVVRGIGGYGTCECQELMVTELYVVLEGMALVNVKS